MFSPTSFSPRRSDEREHHHRQQRNHRGPSPLGGGPPSFRDFLNTRSRIPERTTNRHPRTPCSASAAWVWDPHPQSSDRSPNERRFRSTVESRAPSQLTCPMTLAMTPGYSNETTRRYRLSRATLSPVSGPPAVVSAHDFCFAMTNRPSEARLPPRTSGMSNGCSSADGSIAGWMHKSRFGSPNRTPAFSPRREACPN
jgi:hypothetical protein